MSLNRETRLVGLVEEIITPYHKGVEGQRFANSLRTIASTIGLSSDKTSILTQLKDELNKTAEKKNLKLLAKNIMRFYTTHATSIKSTTHQCENIFNKLGELADTILETREPKDAKMSAEVPPQQVTSQKPMEAKSLASENSAPQPSADLKSPKVEMGPKPEVILEGFEKDFKEWSDKVDGFISEIEQEYAATQKTNENNASDLTLFRKALQEEKEASKKLFTEAQVNEKLKPLQSELKAIKDESGKQLSELDEKLRAKETEKTVLQAALTKEQKESGQKFTKEQLDQRLQPIEKEISDLRTALAKEQKDSSQKFTKAQLEAQLQAKEQEKAEVKATLSYRIKTLTDELEQKTAAIKIHETTKDKWVAERTRLNTDIQRLSEQVNNAEQKTKDFGMLKHQSSTQAKTISALNADLEKITSEFKRVNASFAAFKKAAAEDADHRNTEYLTANNLAKKYKLSIGELESKIASEKAAKLQLAAEVTRLNTKIDALHAEAKKTDEAHKKALKSLEQGFQAERLNTQTNHQSLQQTLATRERELATAIREVAMHKSKLSAQMPQAADGKNSVTTNKPAAFIASRGQTSPTSYSATLGQGIFDEANKPHASTDVVIPIGGGVPVVVLEQQTLKPRGHSIS